MNYAMNTSWPLQRRSRGDERAFTLVELMISIAIAVLILVGINLIFRTTADTVGAGQALNEAMRAQRALTSNLQTDIAGYDSTGAGGAPTSDTGAAAASDAPFILINSTRVAAFRNRQDELSNADYVANVGSASMSQLDAMIRTTDEGITPLAQLNRRNHRVDQLTFFSKGIFNRQTANDGHYVGNFSAAEAMIWYGHLDVYNGVGNIDVAGSYPGPGTPASGGVVNPDNQYAADWRLGRQAILMQEPRLNGTGAEDYHGLILDNDAIAQTYFQRGWTTPTNNLVAGQRLSPLSFTSVTNGIGSVTLPTSRYDLAGIKMELFRDRLDAALSDDPNYLWWANAMGGSYGRRFWCYPIVSGDDLAGTSASANMARSVPQLAQGCTQFIVEFAGDYVTQNSNGDVTSPVSDGVLDFVVVDPAGDKIRSTRWYGFPRDVDGDGYIGAAQANAQHRIDVVPVSVIAGSTVYQVPPSGTIDPRWQFEASVPVATGGYFMDLSQSPGSQDGMVYSAVGSGDVPAGPAYICAWNPMQLRDPGSTPPPGAPQYSLRPWMIRVVATFADKNGRLNDGLTQQYVFNLDK